MVAVGAGFLVLVARGVAWPVLVAGAVLAAVIVLLGVGDGEFVGRGSAVLDSLSAAAGMLDMLLVVMVGALVGAAAQPASTTARRMGRKGRRNFIAPHYT